VRVLGPKPVPPQLQVLVVEVHVGPSQTERLALSQTERQRQRQHPTSAVSALVHIDQQALYFFDGVGLDLLFRLFPPGRLGHFGGVLHAVAAAQASPKAVRAVRRT